MKKTILFMMALMLGINAMNAQTLFEWKTAYYDGDWATEDTDIVEIKEGITVRVRDDYFSPTTHTIADAGVYSSTGATDKIIRFAGGEVTFDFNQPVDVNSILAIDRTSNTRTLTVNAIFIPIGGDNPVVAVPLIPNSNDTYFPASATANLNWEGVTSFTVIGGNLDPGRLLNLAFDNLSISTTLGTDDYKPQKTAVYPNPVAHMLYLKNSVGLKFMRLYNSIGELVVESNQEQMDVSHVSKGIYFLKINTDQGTETKKIIKE